MSLPPWFEYPETPSGRDQTATVIGGGLAGASVAAALARRGWDVTLIERNAGLSSEASGNPSGVVMPAVTRKLTPASRFSGAAFQYALDQFQQLQAHCEAPIYHPVGVIQVNDSAPEFLDVLEKHHRVLHARVLDLEQFQSVTGLGAGRRALYFPTAGWASPVRLCQALIDSQPGRITRLFNKEVIHLQRRSDTWSVFDREEELTETSVVVIANGMEVNRYAQTAVIPVTPARGQISFISTTAFEKPVSNVICSNRGYVIPDRQETMSIGATYERDTTNTEVTQYSHRENLRNLESLGVIDTTYSDVVLGGRAAIRATTPDRLPILGGVPKFAEFQAAYSDLHHGRPQEGYPPPDYHDGLFVAGGFGSRGITHCPYSGEVLARMICGELRDAERNLLGLLHPGRFMVRALKKVAPAPVEEDLGAAI